MAGESMMMIRPARHGDGPAIKELLAENKLLLDGIDYTQFSHPCLVAVRNGEIVGSIQAHVGLPYSIITDLAVNRDHHRKGYGVKLLTAMELTLRSLGVPAYVAFCADYDTGLAEMMERFGMVATGVGRGFVRRL